MQASARWSSRKSLALSCALALGVGAIAYLGSTPQQPNVVEPGGEAPPQDVLATAPKNEVFASRRVLATVEPGGWHGSIRKHGDSYYWVHHNRILRTDFGDGKATTSEMFTFNGIAEPNEIALISSGNSLTWWSNRGVGGVYRQDLEKSSSPEVLFLPDQGNHVSHATFSDGRYFVVTSGETDSLHTFDVNAAQPMLVFSTRSEILFYQGLIADSKNYYFWMGTRNQRDIDEIKLYSSRRDGDPERRVLLTESFFVKKWRAMRSPNLLQDDQYLYSVVYDRKDAPGHLIAVNKEGNPERNVLVRNLGDVSLQQIHGDWIYFTGGWTKNSNAKPSTSTTSYAGRVHRKTGRVEIIDAVPLPETTAEKEMESLAWAENIWVDERGIFWNAGGGETKLFLLPFKTKLGSKQDQR